MFTDKVVASRCPRPRPRPAIRKIFFRNGGEAEFISLPRICDHWHLAPSISLALYLPIVTVFFLIFFSFRSFAGRLVTIGTGSEHEFGGGGGGAVVYHAARHAVAGASCCLNQEMAVHGVHVITIHTESVASEKLFALPKLPR